MALTFGERLAPARRLVFEGLLRWLPALTLAAICAYALAMIFSGVFFTSITYDDGYYAYISRNLAEGRGYITNYGETARIFNPEVSMGPTIILSSAFLQVILGSHYWVANIVVPLIVLPMAAAIGWLLHRKFEVPLIGLGALALAAIAFTDERNDSGDLVRLLSLWSHQMGDIPAVGFALLAALVVTMRDDRPKVHVVGGALLALSLYTRLAMLLVIPAFALFYAWTLWRERDFRQALAFGAGGAAVALPFELFRLAELGSVNAYIDNTRDIVRFYQTWGFGGADHDIESLLRQLSMKVAIFPAVAWAGLLGLDWARRRELTPVESRVLRLAVLLLVAAAIQLYWWLVINDAGWYRHAIPGVMYLAVALIALASHVRWRVMPFATAGVAAVLIVAQWNAVTIWKPFTSQEPRLEVMLAVSSLLQEKSAPGVSYWGCGWWANREMAYVADIHFYDCLDNASVWRHLDNGEQLILVRSEFWNWENNPVLTAIAEDCDRRMIFQEWPFFVCDATPWLRANTPRPAAG